MEVDTYSVMVSVFQEQSGADCFWALFYKNGERIKPEKPRISLIREFSHDALFIEKPMNHIGDEVFEFKEYTDKMECGSKYVVDVKFGFDGAVRSWLQMVGRDEEVKVKKDLLVELHVQGFTRSYPEPYFYPGFAEENGWR